MDLSLLCAVLFSVLHFTHGHVERLNTHQIPRATNTTAPVFHHRSYHNSIVVGGYLYIDGGEIATWNGIGNGDQGDDKAVRIGNITNLPENYTYSIDLSTSWTNETVILNKIEKAAPVLNLGALWPDASGETFYAYGGGVSWALPIDQNADPPNSLWQFTPSAELGTWTEVTVSPSSNFSTLSRTWSGTYGYGNGLGFSLGGVENDATDNQFFNGETLLHEYNYNPPGMVVYNTSTQIWYNVSANPISYYGTAIYGTSHFVTSFGPAGLLFILGGKTAIGGASKLYFTFDDIPIYEPLSRQWHMQKATGDIPLGVETTCAVGVEGDNGTYEIFLYGGIAESIESTVAMGVVYVLSLPSFHWQKHNITPTYGRYKHSCNLVGNRQMAVVGGIIVETQFEALAEGTDDILAADPWSQGLGIFDLSAMEWSDSYDASAPSYITPTSVKAYIRDNGPSPSAWSDPTIEKWFTKQSKKTKSPTPEESSSDKSNHTNVGAIAGGVVGGVVGILIVIAVIFFLLRRRRKESRTSSHVDPKAELGVDMPRQELSSKEKPAEMDTRMRSELEGGWQGHEVQGATKSATNRVA